MARPPLLNRNGYVVGEVRPTPAIAGWRAGPRGCGTRGAWHRRRARRVPVIRGCGSATRLFTPTHTGRG